MGCGTSLDNGTVLVTQPTVTRTYVPTVVVPQTAPVIHVQQQQAPTLAILPPSKQPPRQAVSVYLLIYNIFFLYQMLII